MIDAARRLVQNKNIRARHDPAGKDELLLISRAQPVRRLTDIEVIDIQPACKAIRSIRISSRRDREKWEADRTLVRDDQVFSEGEVADDAIFAVVKNQAQAILICIVNR